MELKRYDKKDCIAVWSNSKAHGELLACASTNLANKSLFDLEILSVDLADPSKNLQLEGKSLYNTPYSCLAWGTFGEKQGTLPYGLIFGGMENGSFTIWNPAEMIGAHDDIQQARIDDQNSFVCAQEADEEGYPITCAEWNALKNNFLAYGSYSSLLILDVAKNISSPQIMQASSTNPHEGTYVTSVSWNKEVPHILASAGGDGLVALYDIKTNKSIFKIKDNFSNNNSRQVKIAWSKHISTQIAVTLDDEKKNQLQIWDLRNQKGPIVVIDRGHNKGIHTMDWSEIDNDLIMMASRDNVVNCWNIKEHDQPMNSKRAENGVLEVAWAKNLPSVYSISTVNGLSVYSLDDRNIHSYIPKWLKVPANSVFNGNQNLITFSEERGNSMIEYSIRKQISNQLAEQIAILQQFMENESVESTKDSQGHTGQFWKLISAKLNHDGDSDIYQFLNLNKQKIIKQLQKYTGKKRDSFSTNNLKSSKKQKQKTSKPDYIPVPVGEAADFFGTLSSEPLQQSFNNKDNEQNNEIQNVKYDMVPRNSNWDIGKEKLIKENMLIGNYEGAIDAAIKCGRTAEALIIAYSIDQAMFNNTLKTFFTETTDKFISGILKHIAFKDTEELVKKYDLDKWKQCIALIFSLSSSQKRKNLLSLLAARLQEQEPNSKEHQEASIYCFILAEQFEKIVQIYEKRLNAPNISLKQKKLNLVIYATRLLAIYQSLTVNVQVSAGFERIIRQVALLCIEVGKKMLAYGILTKYVLHSSTKYINYLIYNTQELSTYRNQTAPIINLPIMPAKKQQKVKKSSKAVQSYEQVPTSIKPSKQPKLPPKGGPFQDEAEAEGPKKKGQVVPPPPPPGHTQKAPTGYNPQKQALIQPPAVVPIVMPEVKSKTPPPPPPPPSKKPQPQEQQEQQDEPHHQPNYQQPTPKKGNVPPPPPPPKSITRPQHVEEEHNTKMPPPPPPSRPQPPVMRAPIQPPVHKNVPPPPPPPTIHHAAKQESAVLPPPKGPSNVKSPPPPPPGRGVVQKQVREQEQQQRYQPQQPAVKTKTPPPPPPSGRVSQQQPRVAPPQNKHQQYQQQQEEESQEYQQPVVEQRPASQKFIQTAMQPPPSAKRGNVPPPPPSRTQPQRVQSQKEQEQEAESSFIQNQQQGKRPPPPPLPAKKGGPPPPPPARR